MKIGILGIGLAGITLGAGFLLKGASWAQQILILR